MNNTNSSKSFLRGNKTAIITFIITIALSSVLFLTGIILSVVEPKENQKYTGSITQISSYNNVALHSGENKFKYAVKAEGYCNICLDSTSGISSIRVTDSNGKTIYSPYSLSSKVCKFQVEKKWNNLYNYSC